jgi:hypothetical protein
MSMLMASMSLALLGMHQLMHACIIMTFVDNIHFSRFQFQSDKCGLYASVLLPWMNLIKLQNVLNQAEFAMNFHAFWCDRPGGADEVADLLLHLLRYILYPFANNRLAGGCSK